MSVVRPSTTTLSPAGIVDFVPLEELVLQAFASELSATPMPGGASTRRYYRLALPNDKSAVAMFVPEGGKPEEVQRAHEGTRWPFLEVRDLLAERGIHVPSVLAEDTPRGWLVIEDLGDDTLANWLLRNPGDKPALYTKAVTDLARAQQSLAKLPKGSVVASRTFDYDLLRWEIEHFREWGLDGRGKNLSEADAKSFSEIADRLAKRVAELPQGFVHRDYQSRNLMVVEKDELRLVWIDFQDALLGPRVYDLVALLNDSYQEFDRAFVEARLAEYAEAAELPAKQKKTLSSEFDLVTVQRKLKDAGRFVFIDKKKGNSSFLRFVSPTMRKVDGALARLETGDPDMKELRAILKRTLGDELTAGSLQAAHKRQSRRAPPDSRQPLKAVEVRPQGLWLRDREELVPLWAGAMHYWRHAPEEWGACLDAMKAMGLRLVDTYIPWGVHETGGGPRDGGGREAGKFDFGEQFGRLDVARFMRLAGDKGMHVIARPGPHINAELTYFGLPERVVWDRECQARTPKDNPVILPLVPVAFPVPSYASNAFHDETALWFDAVGKVLSPLLHPHGPIVMLQVDNEGALYFRDGPYDQDYHPDAIALLRRFLREKYETVKALREVWNDAALTFANVTPPVRFDAKEANDLARHLDWMEFHEYLLAEAMGRFGKALENAGLTSVPTLHNFPLGESATPLNASRMAEVVDLIGLDYYHAANPQHHMAIQRRTGELATRCEGRQVPPFGAEVGAGFPPFFPPLDDKDSLYTLMAALGYGLRGFNLYMAVDRDRWVGAPIDVHGMPRRLADEYHALIEALDKVKFNTLHRSTPVKLVVPRALRRLARATHAFGPVTPTAFHIAGAGPVESCLEDDFGLGEVAPIVGESYVRAFERALLARGVPFSYAGGESLEMSMVGASWIVCTTAGGLKADVFASLRAAKERGILVTIGPRVPTRDGAMRELATPHDTTGLELEALDDPSRADVLVARRIDELSLPAYPVDVPDVHVSLHEDLNGVPRVAFVMNPTNKPVIATVGLGKTRALVDLLPRPRAVTRIEPHAGTGALVVEVPARTIRMFGVET